MKPTSISKVQNSIVLLRQGLSTREIAKRIHISRSTVARIRARSQENIPVSKGGRPSKVSKKTKKVLRRKFDIGAFKDLKEGQRLVQEAEGVHVHTRTIRTYLDMKAYVKRKGPLLSKSDKKARYKFAKNHLHWTVEQWKQVIFSDETLVRMVGSYGRQFYYKDPKKKTMRPHYIKRMVQGGGGIILLWGCLTYWSPGDLSWIHGTMDSETYVDVLKDYYHATIKFYGMNPKTTMLQQDNASSHTSAMTKRFLKKTKIAVLDWPVRSPDLNIIENVWAYIKRRLDEYDTPPESKNDLWNRVQKIWTALPQDFIHRLYESLPKRMKAVYKSRGECCNL
jgi:transposase